MVYNSSFEIEVTIYFTNYIMFTKPKFLSPGQFARNSLKPFEDNSTVIPKITIIICETSNIKCFPSIIGNWKVKEQNWNSSSWNRNYRKEELAIEFSSWIVLSRNPLYEFHRTLHLFGEIASRNIQDTLAHFTARITWAHHRVSLIVFRVVWSWWHWKPGGWVRT